jgi:hypothetical protein
MKDRIKEVYLMLGHVLNNPKAFGMEERMPKSRKPGKTRIIVSLRVHTKTRNMPPLISVSC